MKILWRDNDHVAMDSDSRPGEVAHSLEKTGNKWVCTCENATQGKNPNCKHVRFMEAEDNCKKRES